MDLHAAFLAFARSHGGAEPLAESWWTVVSNHYGEASRHYHTLAHIEELLELLPHADATTLAAVWFHDVIYGGAENEERSAELALRALTELQFPASAVALVEQMILATKTHTAALLPAERRDFLDADLSILGRDRERYRAYADAIRREYAFVPEDAFRAARAQVMRAFLQQPSIYATEAFRARFEEQARANIAWECGL